MDAPLSEQPEIIKKIYRRSIELISADYVALVLEQRQSEKLLMQDEGNSSKTGKDMSKNWQRRRSRRRS